MLRDIPKGLLQTVQGIVKKDAQQFHAEENAKAQAHLGKIEAKMKAVPAAKSDKPAVDGVKKMTEQTEPRTAKEKKLAAMAHPKDKITHKDVLVGRGVIAKEEKELEEGYKELNAKHTGNALSHVQRLMKALNSGKVSGAKYHARTLEDMADSLESEVEAQRDHEKRMKKMAMESAGEVNEGWEDMLKASKKKADASKDKKVTRTGHEVKKISTGTVYTKKYDKKTGLSEQQTDTPGNSAHQCAIHVKSEQFGEGRTLFSQHAEPDADGQIAWYDVMFAEGIKRVETKDLEILVSESHMNHKKKK